MRHRIRQFKQWLLQRPEQNIVIVGHSAFFRDFLQTQVKMKNCEVKQCILQNDGEIETHSILFAGGESLLHSEESVHVLEEPV